MIKIIRPKQHPLHKPKIEALLNLFAVYQNLKLSEEEKSETTFMIAEDETYGVYGGAILQREFIRCFGGRIKKLISTLHSSKRKIWDVNICFYRGPDECYSTPQELDLRRQFYEDLFKNFVLFGRREKVKFLVLTLDAKIFPQTQTYGRWPFLFEVHPNDPNKELFQGIMSFERESCGLSPRDLKAFLKRLEEEKNQQQEESE